MILNVENVSHGFGGRELLEDVNFRLLKGEHIGLVGANGEGKSTFMNILTRKLIPDEGKITWSNRVKVGYLDQHSQLEAGMSIKQVLQNAFSDLFDYEKEINDLYMKMGNMNEAEMRAALDEVGELQNLLDMHDFYNLDVKIDEVATNLGITDLGLQKDVNELSGGQRTKVLLAKLLLEKPDVLLLDEPTNYLDESHIEWLKRYLMEYENAFICISHDIAFLNSVVNLIYHVEDCRLTRYVGSYDDFKRLYEINRSHLEAAFNRQQQEIARLEDFVARNKARVATRGMAASRQKKLDKMELIELSSIKPKPEFNFLFSRNPSRIIFDTTDLVIGYDHPLTSPIKLLIEKGQKVAFTGANGIGKTTLLKSLLGLIPPLSGSVMQGENQMIQYFEQEAIKNNNSCIEEVWNTFPQYTQYEVRSALAKCGLTTQQLESKMYVLSGGEQAKVRLCKLMNKESNILILDEPTNHLDPEAKEELQKALAEYSGTVLVVSHEPEFYQGFVDIVIDCEKFALK